MFEIIKKILIDKLGIDEGKIKPNSYLEKDFELDSTETVLIALEIKKRFGVDFDFPQKDITLSELELAIQALIK
jgi:acyl carrier protein